jgi:KaiC/GvpD/RAD55 family RecA-like ATPase
MTKGVNLISSGFSLVDKRWGGIYRGGSYLLIGPRKSGRTLLSLQFALESAKSSEVCLYFTNMRPKDLMIQAASLNFDIQSYMNQNLLIVVRIAPPNEIYDVPNPDDYLIEYLNDIVTVVNEYNPSRIIFDELTPYIGFRSLNLLKDAFLNTLETVEDKNITSFFVVGEPATQKAQQIVDVLKESVTANLFLKKHAEKFDGKFYGGTAIISPNVGHTEGQFSSNYVIEPYKGVSVDFTPDNESKKEITSEPKENIDSERKDEFHKPLVMPKINNKENEEKVSFSNIYTYEDFQLILNNQIALYKSTGQTFNLISFRLDPTAPAKGLLTLGQLRTSLSKSVTKRDKVCEFENRIIVLIIGSSPKNSADLISKMKNFLPSTDSSYTKAISEYILIYDLEVNENFKNSGEMLEILLSEQGSNAHIPLSDINWA